MRHRVYVAAINAFFIGLYLSLNVNSAAQAGESEAVSSTTQSTEAPLPSPLTLDYIMRTLSNGHPDLVMAQSQIELSRSKLLRADSAYGFRAYLLGEARYIDPPAIAPDQSRNDSRARLIAIKRLYDFGRTANAEKAARADVNGSQWLYKNALNQYRVDVMESFFNVLLADLKYTRDNEAMTVAYVVYDRIRKRKEVGQRSDIQVLKTQSVYQKLRTKLYASRSSQRNTRYKLANILNRPGDLVAEIAEPDLSSINRPVPEVEKLQAQALKNNPLLVGLRAQVEAAEKRVAAARAGHRPTIDGTAEAATYAREMGSYNDWEASLILNVPLLDGGKVKAEVAQKQAEFMRLKAKLKMAEMDVQQAVLDNWQMLDTLKAEKEEMNALMDYRDLYLDRSRALYEMEVKTDLGDSMAKISDARYKMAKNKYNTALTWARLDALLGKEIYAVKEHKQ